MRARTRWIVGVAAAALLSAGGARVVMKRAAAPKPAPPVAAEAARSVVELAPGDVAVAANAELAAALAVSGGLKAVDSAFVKARVAAEVAQLTVREGDRVSAGQRIGRLDDTEYRWRLRQAEDQAAAAQAQLEIAERTLANNKALVDQGFISKTALDTSVSSASGAQASLQAAKAAAEIARKAVRDCEIVAPIGGIVSQRLVQPGERVPVDTKLVEIVDLSRIELEAAVTPEDVLALRVGQKATLQIDGLASPVPAKVARIAPSTQSGTRAVMTYLQVLPGPAAAGLRQGLFARGSIEVERRNALVVPVSAVRFDQSKPYVLVAAEGKAVMKPVTPGARGDIAFGAAPEPAVEITSGLAAGETVLRGTVGTLRDGTPIRLAAAR